MAHEDSFADARTVSGALYSSPTFSIATQQILSASESALDSVREKVDKRIHELELEIRSLRTFRNSTASTASLPAEILSQIFLALRSSASDSAYRPLTWLSVTRVSRQWRAVALSCPALWSNISFTCRPEFTDLMVARSRDVPLTLKITAYSQRVTFERVEKILSQHRVRAFEWTGESTSLNRQFFGDKNIFTKMKNLTELRSVLVRGNRYPYYSIGVGPVVTVPDGTFQDATCLERLEMVECAITSWTSIPCAPGLTVLKLENTSSFRPSLGDLLNTLTATPKLQELYLKNILPHISSTPRDEHRVSLPALRNLRLTGDFTEVNQLLTCVHIPDTASLNIHLPDGTLGAPTLTAAAIEPLFKTLKNNWVFSGNDSEGHPSRPLTTLRITLPPQGVAFEGMFGDESSTSVRPTSMMLSIPHAVASALLQAVIDNVDISHVQTLQLEDTEVTADVWTETFSQLTGLKTIQLIESPIASLVECLARDPNLPKTQSKRPKKANGRTSTQPKRVSARQSAKKPFFPALRTLELTSVNFDEDLNRDNATVDLFLDVMGRRPNAYAVETVRIDDALSFSNRDYLALKDKVGQVVWDHMVDMQDTDGDEDYDMYGYSDDYEGESDYDDGECTCGYCHLGL